MAGRGSKPGERRGGRKKGTPNKVTTDLRLAILGALDKVSSGQPEKYFAAIAVRHPQVFCTLVARLLPKDVQLSMPPVEPDARMNMLDTARRMIFLLAAGEADIKRPGRKPAPKGAR